MGFAEAIEENLARLNDGFLFEGTWPRALVVPPGVIESVPKSALSNLRRLRPLRCAVETPLLDLSVVSRSGCSSLRIFFRRPTSTHEFSVRSWAFPVNRPRPILQANPAFRSRSVRRLVGSVAQSPIRRILPGQVRAMLVRRLSKVGSGPKLEDSVRARLDEHYEPHIREVESVTERDLSHWRGAGS